MDTEQFLILAEEIAKQHPEDAMSVSFLEMCNETVINERECLVYAGKVVAKHLITD
jgi:hypothetical protein